MGSEKRYKTMEPLSKNNLHCDYPKKISEQDFVKFADQDGNYCGVYGR